MFGWQDRTAQVHSEITHIGFYWFHKFAKTAWNITLFKVDWAVNDSSWGVLINLSLVG